MKAFSGLCTSRSRETKKPLLKEYLTSEKRLTKEFLDKMKRVNYK